MIITTPHKLPRFSKRLTGQDINSFDDLPNKVSISFLCSIVTELTNLHAEHYNRDYSVDVTYSTEDGPVSLKLDYNQLARLVAEQIPYDIQMATNSRDSVWLDSVFSQ